MTSNAQHTDARRDLHGASRIRTLGTRTVGPGHPVYVTGEIGINHNGDLENAFALIDAAAGGGLRRGQVPEADSGDLHPA